VARTALQRFSNRRQSRRLLSQPGALHAAVERLGDLFEPRLCDTLRSLFSEVIAYVRPEFTARGLIQRYQWVAHRVSRPIVAKTFSCLSTCNSGATSR